MKKLPTSAAFSWSTRSNPFPPTSIAAGTGTVRATRNEAVASRR
jgi:hypothetical protein